jgi:hypothetical protein
MASQPLTHHEIIGLVEPFTRRGRHVDLANSDRHQRLLRFKPVLHAHSADGLPALTETLQLENPAAGKFRLTRTLTPAIGPAASLTAEGVDRGDLLAQVDAVAPAEQMASLDGAMIALSHRLEAGAKLAPDVARRVLTRGVAMMEGLTLTMKMPSVPGMPADLELVPNAAGLIDLPEDLLAVLGWRWTRLIRSKDIWRASVRLRGNGATSSADAEAGLEHAARHLARTLAEAPASFHRRHVPARWGVFARRAIPLMAIIALIATGIAIPSLNLSQESVVRMLIFNSPPLLMIVVFGMREVPRIEIPPVPRASPAPAWQTNPKSAAPSASSSAPGRPRLPD